MTGAIAVSDLDRTLIYSASAVGMQVPDAAAPRLLCVEVYNGLPLSFVTERAAALLTGVMATGRLVPVTTRTVAQFRRVHLPGVPPRYAICTNGGHLLVEGAEDPDFTRAVEDRLSAAGAPHPEVLEEVRRRAGAAGTHVVHRVHDAAGLFCYAVVDRASLPAAWLESLAAYAEERAWTVSVQGRKIYVVPAALTKAAAARELADRLGSTRMIAAGDSLLDADLLMAADEAIRPAHGELADRNWQQRHLAVTASTGVLAGEEIAEWLAGALARAGHRDLASSDPSTLGTTDQRGSQAARFRSTR